MSLPAALGLAATLLAALIAPGSASLFLFVVFTGFAPLALLGGRWSVSGFVGAAVALGVPLWGCYSLVAWEMEAGARGLGFAPAVGAAVCVAVLAVLGRRWRRWRGPLRLLRPGLRDTLAAGLGAAVAIPMLMIQGANGPKTVDGVEVFQARHWVALDSLYLFGLAQSALETQEYPEENVFVWGAENRYPSLLHCGLAGLTQATGRGRDAEMVAAWLWKVWPVWLVAGVIAGFGAVSSRRGAGGDARNRWLWWLAAGYAGYVLLRLDLFVYPHTHGLAMGLLSILLVLLPHRAGRGREAGQWVRFGFVGLLLVASHTVTSLVAIVLAGGFVVVAVYGRRWRDVYWPAGVAAVLVAGFAYINFGETHEAVPTDISGDYKWLAALAMVGPYVVPLGIALLLAKRSGRPAVGMAAAVLVGATVVYWCYGFWGAASFNAMSFAIYNAPRFGLYGLFLGLFSGRAGRTGAWAMGGLLGYSLLMPTVTVRQLPLLVTQEPQWVDLEQMRRLRREVAGTEGVGDAGVMTNAPGYLVAMFLGRPLFWTDGSYYGFGQGVIDEAEMLERAGIQHRHFHELPEEGQAEFLEREGLVAVTSGTYELRMPFREQ